MEYYMLKFKEGKQKYFEMYVKKIKYNYLQFVSKDFSLEISRYLWLQLWYTNNWY